MNDHFGIHTDCLSEKELANIKEIARDMLACGQYGKDQFQIAILAFLYWCGESGTQISVTEETSANQTVH